MATDEKNQGGEAGKPRKPSMALALLFGIGFGFLLQKGGVAKYEILMGQFFLTDFTVVKVMLTAIIVGMVGVYGLHALGKLELHVKPTRYASNITGGLLFGVGLGLLGYCPGTGAAAVGQGNLDALAGIAGLVAGSWIYAETSGFVAKTIHRVGDRGKVVLADLVHVKLPVFIALFAALLGAGLALVQQI